MSHPTWGIYIPGYSNPSEAQRKLFERKYPGVAARVNAELEQAKKELFEEQHRLVIEDRKRRDACAHLFVPTNVDDEHVCRHCGTHIQTRNEIKAPGEQA